MQIFILILLVALIALFIGYQLGANVVVHNAEDFGLVNMEDGDQEKIEDVSFLYCQNNKICEAFQISSGCIPGWAFADNIDIYISPRRKVVVHRSNGYNVIAAEDDYLINNGDGDFFACPAQLFENTYTKIDIKNK